MRLPRIVIIVVIIAAGALLIFSVLKPQVPLPVNTGLPVDLQTMIPTSWKVVPGQFKTCDFDGDGDNEYLIIYNYDASSGPITNTVAGRSLIGGAIYDTQVNRVPQAPGVEAPYRPAFMVPYKLLPDLYGGKGQGYLGESSVTVTMLPQSAEAKCQAKEIMVAGFSYDNQPTALSIFRWEGETIGYVGWHVRGNVRLRAYDAANAPNSGKAVVGVYVYNDLNQRSLLCGVRHYRRTPPVTKEDLPPGLDFVEVKGDYTMDFCYGAPKDPAYPEGVAVALLRGQNPPPDTPTGGSFLAPEALTSLPPELVELKNAARQSPIRILSVSSPGSLGWYPPQGSRFEWTPTGTPAPTPQVWWRSSDPPARVETEIVLNDGSGQTRQATWFLVSLANEKADADTHWRITRVELR
jgi:hypothetical protein